MATYEDYIWASRLNWGQAGEFAATEFARLNRELFAGSIPPVPVIIGLTAYGKCLGVTRREDWMEASRITLAPEIFNGSSRTPGGPLMVLDVLVHEMVHVVLILRGEDHTHNGDPWCKVITELSPELAGREVSAQPVRPKRVPNPDRETDPKAPKTKVVRRSEPGWLTQMELSRWPMCIRPQGYYAGQEPIWVPTY